VLQASERAAANEQKTAVLLTAAEATLAESTAKQAAVEVALASAQQQVAAQQASAAAAQVVLEQLQSESDSIRAKLARVLDLQSLCVLPDHCPLQAVTFFSCWSSLVFGVTILWFSLWKGAFVIQ
jgi:hypothetical protein